MRKYLRYFCPVFIVFGVEGLILAVDPMNGSPSFAGIRLALFGGIDGFLVTIQWQQYQDRRELDEVKQCLKQDLR